MMQGQDALNCSNVNYKSIGAVTNSHLKCKLLIFNFSLSYSNAIYFSTLNYKWEMLNKQFTGKKKDNVF